MFQCAILFPAYPLGLARPKPGGGIARAVRSARQSSGAFEGGQPMPR
jgi:hypothetical protein